MKNPRTTPSRFAIRALSILTLAALGAFVPAMSQTTAAAVSAGTHTEGNPVTEVEAFERELMKVFSNDVANHVDEVMDHFYDGPELLQFDLMTPREYDGPAAFRKHFAELATQFNGKVELVDMRVHADNHIAFVSSVQHNFGSDPSGKPFDMSFRVTDCLIKVKGKWKILHEHVSFPIDMATGKPDSQSKK